MNATGTSDVITPILNKIYTTDSMLGNNYPCYPYVVKDKYMTITFNLTGMSYWNPSLISFQGFTEKGEPVELIQHVSQISILLQKAKRKNPETPKIGFVRQP